MAALRKPEPDPEPRRPHLAVVPRSETVAVPGGSPARGILIGVALSVLGFWLPAALLVLHR